MVLLPQDPTVCQTLNRRTPRRTDPGRSGPEGKECPYWVPRKTQRPLFADIPPVSTRRRTIACATGVLLTTPPHPHNTGHGDREALLRKEVIQPHLPVRLPCYDLVPIASPTFDSSLPQGVRPPASGVTNFRDLTGGVYKARERIHRSVADLRLLATPTSWGRVADPNPN